MVFERGVWDVRRMGVVCEKDVRVCTCLVVPNRRTY